jgi:hypothetical protein
MFVSELPAKLNQECAAACCLLHATSSPMQAQQAAFTAAGGLNKFSSPENPFRTAAHALTLLHSQQANTKPRPKTERTVFRNLVMCRLCR